MVNVCAEVAHNHYISVYSSRLVYTAAGLKSKNFTSYLHFVSVIQTSQLMLYREILAVCSEIHTLTSTQRRVNGLLYVLLVLTVVVICNFGL